MKIYNHLDSINPGMVENTVVTIGNFDGVHRGHRALLGSVVEKAKQIDGIACAVTFWPHPQAIVGDRAPMLIATLTQRQQWIEKTGIDVLVVQQFDKAFASTEPMTFLELLAERLGVSHLILGHDFHFGKGGRGNIELAHRESARLGFSVDRLEQVYLGESVVSSSHVREALASADVRRAHEYLGRPWQIWGAATSGAGRGKTLGFPTVNFQTENEICVPDGVYGGRIVLSTGSVYTAAISVGVNPTFGGDPRHIEAFILDCEDPDVSGVLTLEFLSYLRSQVTYTDAAKLIEQIDADVDAIRQQAQHEGWL